MFEWLVEDILKVVKVLYSPIEAFKKITEEPKFRGLLIIFILFVSATIGLEFARNSKIFIETSVLRTTLIPGIGPVYNITEGFGSLNVPTNLILVTYNWTGTVTIYGTNETAEVEDTVIIQENYTVYETNKAFKTINNVTFNEPGDGKTQYIGLGVPGEYRSLLATYMSTLALNSVMGGLMNLFWEWGLYSIVFLLIIKVSRIEMDSWSNLFITLGYTFIVGVIQLLIYTLVYLPLPSMNVPLKVWAAPSTEPRATVDANQIFSEKWGAFLVIFNFLSYIPYILLAWRAILSVIAVRFLYDLSWKKAIIISAIGCVVATFLIPYGINFLLRGGA